MRRFIKNQIILLALALSLVMSTGLFVVDVKSATTEEKLREAQEGKAQSEGKLNETKDRIGNLEDSKTALQGYLTELNDDLTEVSDKLSGIEDELDEKETEIEKTQSDINGLEAEIDETQKEIEKTQSEIDEQYELIKKRIRHVYRSGGANYADVLLGATSFSDMLNKTEYINKASDYDENVLKNIKEKKASLEDKKAKTEELKGEVQAKMQKQQEELEDIEDLHAAAAKEQGKVQTLVNRTTNGISSYKGQIEQAEAEAKAYEADIAQKNEDIKRLEKELEKERALAAKSRSMAKKDLSQISVAEGERELLACLIYCEAGAEPYEGQVAVGAVVMNRCMSGAFPDTITGVIYQSGQFSPVASGRLAARLAQGANDSCYKAADAALSGHTPVGDCLFFRTIIPEIKGQIIGNHVFYNP